MKRQLPILMVFGVCLLSAGCQTSSLISYSGVSGENLAPCSGAPTPRNWTNCHGSYHLTNGEKYVGEFKNGKMHGQGTYTWSAPSTRAGEKYVGEFRNGKLNGQGTYIFPRGSKNTNCCKHVGEWKGGLPNGLAVHIYADGRVEEGMYENGKFQYAQKVSPTVTARKSPPPKSSSTGSGFFVSNLGHVVTNQHVVDKCKSVTIGDSAKKQVTASVLETDQRNDLALLRISTMEMASAKTKTLVAKLGLSVTPLASQGLLRLESVELGEDVVVAGFPFGDLFSNTIKITKGVVSAKRGIGDDSSKFQLDAAVQPGNSGGPIYDENGNIIGVVVSQLNKLKVAKAIGSMPENVNFGIKASIVKQFLNSSGLPSSWSKRTKKISTKDIAKIAENQTVMVICHK